jgi:uncharacterized protein
MKYLVVLLVVVLVFALMLGRRRKPPQAKGRAGQSQQEEMVRCAHCGVHLPRSDALLAGGELFCSDAHRIAGAGPRR